MGRTIRTHIHKRDGQWHTGMAERCGKCEKTQRWTDGRYSCDLFEGHAGNCSAWSRSASGRQVFKGFEPCEHIKAGDKECGCVLTED